MPSAVNQRAGPAAPGDVENIFNYDDAVEDFLKDLPLAKDAQNNSASQGQARNFDEEIVVKKKRKPVPKLDESRLLSQGGVPRLRKITKSRLKFRGKGHEFSDISTLLNTYQLWLDDLYPRAKFRDALMMVEKLGHSKRIQVTRKAWLDDTKPHRREASPERVEDVEMSGALPADGAGGEPRNGGDESDDAVFDESAPRQNPPAAAGAGPFSPDAPEDDELDALLAESATTAPQRRTETQAKPRGPFVEDDQDEDELDALLAEEPSFGLDSATTASKEHVPPEDDFANEEEAMASMGGMW